MNQTATIGQGYTGSFVQSGPTPPPMPITIQVNDLSAQADELSKTIEELAQRLCSVVSPEAPSVSLQAVASPAPPKSDHLYKLEDIARRHRDSISRLRNFMSRLEV